MSQDFGKSSPTQRSLYPKMKAHQSCPALPGPQQLALHAPLLRGVERQRGEGKTTATAARVEKNMSTPAESTSTGAISAPSAGTPMVCVFFFGFNLTTARQIRARESMYAWDVASKQNNTSP